MLSRAELKCSTTTLSSPSIDHQFALLAVELGQAVIKEAMRMHPGVRFPLERVIYGQGVKLCDVNIPSGTIVGMDAWVVYQNRGIYGHEAQVFRPER